MHGGPAAGNKASGACVTLNTKAYEETRSYWLLFFYLPWLWHFLRHRRVIGHGSEMLYLSFQSLAEQHQIYQLLYIVLL
jgi:hypothetical protein